MTDKKNKDPITKFYEYLSKVKGISDRTIYHYLTYHRHFMDQEITQKSINNFLQSKNNNTVCRSYLKAYLEFKGLHKQFEIPKARSGTTKKRMIRYITRHEIKKVISQAYERGLKQGIMIDLLYYGALRRSEVLTIRTNSFKWDDLSKDYVKLKITGKGKKDRNVLIPTQTVRKILFIYMKRGMINDHMERDDIITKLSFIDDPLIKYTEKGIWRIIRDISKKALGGKTIRPHEIRHARATHMLEDGIPERTIQRYLGHSSLAVTEIYLHTTEKKALDDVISLSKNL